MGGNDTIFRRRRHDVLDAATGSKLAGRFSGRDDVTALPSVDLERNKYYTNGKADINPALRKNMT